MYMCYTGGLGVCFQCVHDCDPDKISRTVIPVLSLSLMKLFR